VFGLEIFKSPGYVCTAKSVWLAMLLLTEHEALICNASKLSMPLLGYRMLQKKALLAELMTFRKLKLFYLAKSISTSC